jgi:hypothetical protein
MLATELTLARSGALDADLISNQEFYGADFTRTPSLPRRPPVLLQPGECGPPHGHPMGCDERDGELSGNSMDVAVHLVVSGPRFRQSANVDFIAVYLTGAATILLLAVPFIPGLRDIRRVVPVDRLVWRDWYRRGSTTGGGSSTKGRQAELTRWEW